MTRRFRCKAHHSEIRKLVISKISTDIN